jgi:hypothetical protein
LNKADASSAILKKISEQGDNYGSGNLYSLSLLQANLSVLTKIGINPQNIVVAKNCTCCNEIFGSNRRETLSSDNFTVQAAFLGYF